MSARAHRPLLTLGGPLAAAIAIGAAIYAGALGPAWGSGVLVLALLGPLWTFRAHSPSILLVFFAVLLGGVVTSSPLPTWRSDRHGAAGAAELQARWSKSGRFDDALPIVLHLVFDEFMSAGAVPEAFTGAAALRGEVRALAGRHALRLFDSVYSRHYFSADALPNMMAAGYRGERAAPHVADGEGQGIRDNEAFRDLERRGYRTIVFQTSHINFCGSPAVDTCETFASFDPAQDRTGQDAGPSRTAALWSTIVRSYEPSFTSRLGRLAIDGLDGWRVPQANVLGVADRYDVQGFPAWFDRFAKFVAEVPRGTHVYAHFMVPHAPYLLTEDCRIDGRFIAGYDLASRFPPDQRDAARRDFYRQYISQTRCVVRKLDELLGRIGQVEAYRDATVIIHGDHGSRISSGSLLEDMKEQDFIDNYATLFAVRSPAAAPGVDCGLRSLDDAFRQVFATPDDRREPGDAMPVSVVSRAAAGAKVDARMPAFGCAADGR